MPTVFAVPKDTDQDRLITDAVFANAHFVEPAKVKLPDPSHLARLVTSTQSGPLYIAKSDLSNFYHHLALPLWMRPYFCLVGVPAAELGLPGDHLVYPMLHTTPTGWSNSVDIAQDAHENVLYSSGALVREHSLLGASLNIVGDTCHHGVYIDDLFIMGHSESKTNKQLDLCLSAYHGAGFVVKSSKVQRASADGVDVLGMKVSGRDHRVEVGC